MRLLLAYAIIGMMACYPVYKVRIVGDDRLFDPKDYQVAQDSCNHFYVSEAIERDYYDNELYDLIEQIRKEEGWSCACIYCHKKTTCY